MDDNDANTCSRESLIQLPRLALLGGMNMRSMFQVSISRPGQESLPAISAISNCGVSRYVWSPDRKTPGASRLRTGERSSRILFSEISYEFFAEIKSCNRSDDLGRTRISKLVEKLRILFADIRKTVRIWATCLIYSAHEYRAQPSNPLFEDRDGTIRLAGFVCRSIQ